MEFIDTLKPYLNSIEIEKLLESFNYEDTHAVILNNFKIKEEDFLKEHPNVKKHPIVSNAYIFDKKIYELGKEIAYDQGIYSIQDPSAMLPAFYLNPLENEIVLDMCAAPGGKTIQCSLSMKNKGILIANDLSYPRAKSLSQNIERMGLGNVIVTSTDFSKSYKHYLNVFDRILLDAPCSGSAMFRKNELAKEDWSFKKVQNCCKTQAELLETAFQMLKPGGIICYSTCSFSYQEDDEQIINFLNTHPDAKVVNVDNNEYFVRSTQLPQAVHILPTHFNGEGQFFCLIQKEGIRSANSFKIKSTKTNTKFIDDYCLVNRSNEIFSGSLYSLTHTFDCSYLNVLRYGIKVCELDNPNIPDHNLSHFLTNDFSSEITEEDMKKYVSGNIFSLQNSNGFKIVSYNHVNLGFIKVVNGIAKNHYPKGLRRNLK